MKRFNNNFRHVVRRYTRSTHNSVGSSSLTSARGWEISTAFIGANDPREDRSGIHEFSGGALFTVIDGHGGFECADYVDGMVLPRAAGFIEEGSPPDEALGSAVLAAEEEWLARVRNQECGPSCGACICVVHVEGSAEAAAAGQGRLTVGNSGDCRCVLGTEDANGDIKAVALSRDHNARMPEEQRRLIQEHPGESDVVMRPYYHIWTHNPRFCSPL
jgi:pyruvate dehydrogenase phosphatase